MGESAVSRAHCFVGCEERRMDVCEPAKAAFDALCGYPPFVEPEGLLWPGMRWTNTQAGGKQRSSALTEE